MSDNNHLISYRGEVEPLDIRLGRGGTSAREYI